MIKRFFKWTFTISMRYSAIIGVGMASILCIPLAIFVGLREDKKRATSLLARLWSRLILIYAGTRVQVIGRQNLRFAQWLVEETGKKVVFISSHRSALDIPILIYFLKMNLTIMAKEELFKIPGFNRAMEAAGIIKTPRFDPKRAWEALDEAMTRMQTTTHHLLNYIEGTRGRGNVSATKLMNLKKGGVVAVIKLSGILVPVALIGTSAALPPKTIKLDPFKRIRLVIGEPIIVENLTYEDRNVLLEWVKLKIEKMLRQYQFTKK